VCYNDLPELVPEELQNGFFRNILVGYHIILHLSTLAEIRSVVFQGNDHLARPLDQLRCLVR
jgi:hypothetical protein